MISIGWMIAGLSYAIVGMHAGNWCCDRDEKLMAALVPNGFLPAATASLCILLWPLLLIIILVGGRIHGRR